ncbi:MAG: non-hydrolyzing UDP-N-acetylglucosamine 2-epimerase [Filifactoraceae bacterium]
MSIFGTRPEAIKMAPLVNLLKLTQGIESKVIVTAQHRQMLDSVLELFNIVPDYDLDIMQHGQTITDITSRVMKGLEEIFKSDRPDVILVHGDTTTTFAAALAAFYQQIPVHHVEAGLRTGNIYSPYPEEMNRKLTGQLSSHHYAPTQLNKGNLLKEGVKDTDITITGNTVIDALSSVVKSDYTFQDDKLNKLPSEKKVVLLTCHRRENWGFPMRNIFTAIKRIAQEHKECIIVFPMHLNPIVRDMAKDIMGNIDNIVLTEPLDYEPFTNLMARSYLVLTDSGGIQEEAPGLGKPVIVLRTETERPEAVDAGTVIVAGVEENSVYKITKSLLTDTEIYNSMAHAVNPYGDGTASKQIVKSIKKICKK